MYLSGYKSFGITIIFQILKAIWGSIKSFTIINFSIIFTERIN